MPQHGVSPGEVTLPISSIQSKVKHPHIQKCKGTTVCYSSSSSPHPQPREDTVKPHLKTLRTHGAFTRAQKEPGAPTEVRLCFQLERQPSSLLKVEAGLAQCHQMHHLNEGKELWPLPAALSHASSAQIKLTPATSLSVMALLPSSLGCCQNNSEMMLSRAMPQGLGV